MINKVLLFTCLPYFVYNVISNGAFFTSVSSIQARFSLTSVDVGVIIGMMDLASIIMLIVIAFIGENANKPRWLSINFGMVGLGAIVLALSHFTAPVYQVPEDVFVNYCGNVTTPECKESPLRAYIAVFISGMLFIGTAWASIYTHGLTYIDDNTTAKQCSVYTSLFHSMAAVGSFTGFILGGSFTELFVHPFQKVQINSSHPYWIGAWWPPYVIFGGVGVMFSILFMRLASNLPQENKSNRYGDNSKQKPIPNWRERFRKLSRNVVFVLTTINIGLVQAFILGFSAFGVKYIEFQYGLTTFTASLAFGLAAVISITFGHLCSGFIMSKWNLNVEGMIKFCIIAAIMSALCNFGFFFYCDDDKFAGITVEYDNASSITGLHSACNEGCGCNTDWYRPVRGSDDIIYFSPCYAGCLSVNENQTYFNCVCIGRKINKTNVDKTALHINSRSGEFCTMVFGFASMTVFAMMTSVMVISPTIQITLRIVDQGDRSSAIGSQQIIAILLGNLPGRILSGKILDSTCLTWSTKCGRKSDCKSYRKFDMASYMCLLLEVEAVVILILYVAIYFAYKQKLNREKSTITEGRGNPCFIQYEMATM